MTVTSRDAPPARGGAGAMWWRDAVIYQIYIRSFADSDGDGIGDLEGIRSRLPYLRDLRVDAIWITPFYPSPMADGGYDVADYRDVHPLFGSLDEFDALLRDAHAAGIRVIVDLVPNHTSDRHAWFTEALAAPRGSAARDRYIFRDGRGDMGVEPPNDWGSTFGGPAWTRTADGQWYLHLFAPGQPDLNWVNTEVREEFESILRFWFDRGVDGFRIDVAHGLIKDPALPDLGEEKEAILEPTRRVDHPHWDRDEIHDVYRAWRKVSDSYDGDRVFVGEAWVASPERLVRYLRPGELHTAFNFDFLKAEWGCQTMRDVIQRCLDAVGSVGAPATWVLSNHDVVRHVTRYGGGEVGSRRARATALLMLALPGSAYVYQGDELGLWEVEDLPEDVLADPVWERSGHTDRGRDGCRVPLPWSGDTPTFGFGPDGSLPWLPPPAQWRGLSVEAQHGDPASALELYRSALRIRREHPALGAGALRWLSAPDDVLMFERDPGFACAVNFADRPAHIRPPGTLLLSSSPLPEGLLPVASAAWFATGRSRSAPEAASIPS
ncbi:MAG: DUF3459 domain-containing protein [Nitriliruptorales bacterium]|nr:DUF3459 domain-containing protein [Nitriliruptorales bacterium]